MQRVNHRDPRRFSYLTLSQLMRQTLFFPVSLEKCPISLLEDSGGLKAEFSICPLHEQQILFFTQSHFTQFLRLFFFIFFVEWTSGSRTLYLYCLSK